MAGTQKKRERSFLWQGMLMLLPVGIMGAIALTATLRDRASVERESRRRAEEIAQLLRGGLEQRWAAELTKWEVLSGSSAAAADAKLPWPDSNSREALLTISSNNAVAFGEAQKSYPGINVLEHLPKHVDFTTNGMIRFPPGDEFPPQPASWFVQLTPEHRQAWDEIKQAEMVGDTNKLEGRISALLATQPEAEIAANAEFIALRSRAQQMPPAEAVPEIARFIRAHEVTHVSESGIPLNGLAFSEALRWSREIGPTKSLWDSIPYSVQLAPSFLTAHHLEALKGLASGKADLEQSVETYRGWWASQTKARELALAIQRGGYLRGVELTSFWMKEQGETWFCNTKPLWINPHPAFSNEVIAVMVYPKVTIEGTLRRILSEIAATVPDFLSVQIDLGGERLLVPDGRPVETRAIWAAAEGSLSHIVRQASGNTGNAPASELVEHESFPSRPKFVVQVALTDPTAMLREYRNRVWMMTGLIVASALVGVVGFLAARRAFTRQLRLNEMKSNFVSSVSHELRAPIASVRLMAESLERGKIAEPARQGEYFRFIGQECRRLSSLIENVLDFSRIEQGRKQYEIEPTDIVGLVGQTVKLMEAYAAEKGVKLQSEISSATPEIAADGRALQQALVNLIDNAIKHSPQGETVRVELVEASGQRQDETVIRLSVSDRGPGIPASEHEKIFERFYRLGSELRRETQGVGIGLSIVKHIVEAHGGQVRVESESGQGSRFDIELPVKGKQP